MFNSKERQINHCFKAGSDETQEAPGNEMRNVNVTNEQIFIVFVQK